jgi:hypothetical protein
MLPNSTTRPEEGTAPNSVGVAEAQGEGTPPVGDRGCGSGKNEEEEEEEEEEE